LDLVYHLNYADCSRMSLRPRTVVKPKLDKSETQCTVYSWGTANKASKHAGPMQVDAELLVAGLIHARIVTEWRLGNRLLRPRVMLSDVTLMVTPSGATPSCPSSLDERLTRVGGGCLSILDRKIGW
jgi:hypothetical protein